MADDIVKRLRSQLPKGDVLSDPGDLLAYGYDNSRRQARPSAVVFVHDTDQVVDVVRACNEAGAGLVARGLGSNTTGATVPLADSVVMSFERMNAIVSIEPDDRIAVVQPGVTNAAVQEAAAAHGAFWPPDPSSAAHCTVGGNIACNAAGPRALKYGVTRDNVLGLTAVTGAGLLLRTGHRTSKGTVGYDLTRLLVGSEGTLAVVTEAVLKLMPLPECVRTLRALYDSIGAAAAAVARIMSQPVISRSLEFADAQAVRLIRESDPALLPAPGTMLIVEVDGAAATIDHTVDAVSAAARGAGLTDLAVARNEGERHALWAGRKALSPALRRLAPTKINEDVVVPVSRLAELVERLGELSREYGVPIVNFGHAGNGNIHVNLLGDATQPGRGEVMHRCLEDVFRTVLDLGGALSGEHGIGLAKQPFVSWELSDEVLSVMRGIKHLFDPNGVLNPGKLLPPAGLT